MQSGAERSEETFSRSNINIAEELNLDMLTQHGLKMLLTIKPAWWFAILTVSAISLFMSDAAAQHHAWPIKRFEVVQTEPKHIAKLVAEWLNEDTGGLGYGKKHLELWERIKRETYPLGVELTDDQISDIERYLGRVAQQFEDWGLPPPALKPVVETDDGGKAYQVYFFGWGKTKVAAKTFTACPASPGAPNYMTFNTSHEKNIKNGKLTPELYQDLAHELFHAVQNNSVMSRDLCLRFGNNDFGHWFTEGSAEAIGIDTARILRGTTAYSRKGHRWGLRGYHRDLQDVVNRSEGYRIHGLWRYLAEAKHTLETRGDIRPSAGLDERSYDTDYSYLKDFLAQPVAGEADRDNELKWFDTSSRAVFGVGADIMYHNFAPTFAHYARERFNLGASASDQQKEATWLERAFGSCREHVLTDQKPYSTALVRHQRVSAKCIRIRPDVQGQVDISITREGGEKEQLRALSIGRGGGAQVGRPTLASGSIGSSPHHIAGWTFNIAGGESHVFVISNAANDLVPTRAQEGEFRIEMFSNVHSMHTGARQQPASSEESDRSDGVPPSATDEGIQQTAHAIEAGLVSLSSHSRTWSTVARNPERDPGCSAGLAAANLCGPNINISLELSPGPAGNIGLTTGAGGDLGRFISMMQGLARAGIEDTGAAWARASETAFQQSGASVTLNIGLIDYGYSGAVNNALILVNKGGSRTSLESVEPTPTIIDGVRVYRPSGKVTIDEYGPHAIRGSYSGSLVDPSEWDGEGPMPTHGTISGRFNLTDPWRSDKRYAVTAPDNLVQSAMDDLRQTIPGLSGFAGKPATPSGQRDDQARSPGSGNTTTKVAPECDCGCDSIDQLPERCESVCFKQIIECTLGD